MPNSITTVAGTVKQIFPEEQITEKMRKAVIWVSTDDEYPQTYEIEFVNQKIDLLSGVTNGAKVNVEVYVNGREWSKGDRSGVFISLRANNLKTY